MAEPVLCPDCGWTGTTEDFEDDPDQSTFRARFSRVSPPQSRLATGQRAGDGRHRAQTPPAR